jgi:hypothetical protein
MDASMLGVGVGFDTDGAGKVVVKGAVSAFDPYYLQVTAHWTVSALLTDP